MKILRLKNDEFGGTKVVQREVDPVGVSRRKVSFNWKTPGFLLKNVNFAIKQALLAELARLGLRGAAGEYELDLLSIIHDTLQ